MRTVRTTANLILTVLSAAVFGIAAAFGAVQGVDVPREIATGLFLFVVALLVLAEER